MALYVVHHTHRAETCPTKNPDIMRQLSEHVTQANADRYGVTIVADWVNEPEHTVILVLEADSADQVNDFAQPFANVGPITVKVGSTWEEVAQECLDE